MFSLDLVVAPKRELYTTKNTENQKTIIKMPCLDVISASDISPDNTFSPIFVRSIGEEMDDLPNGTVLRQQHD
jgi:hypothetical protein